ncbi:MAG: hypothetical protein A3H79_01085 [Candidatus Levybacteria bacterium RIFCSPLOWO2_02_FULL_36_8b]|nr:MAG: hypothetical protein A3H79_01085 [Candidatus Levybacteria bacterium RIFCSPLOWO2_02_FULL_36_8b]
MKKQIYLILTDENLFHPYYFLGILSNISNKKLIIAGVSIIKETYRKNFLKLLYQQYMLWGFMGFATIALLSIYKSIIDKLHIKQNYSIQNIARVHKIPFVEIDNVNDNNHIAYIKKLHPDIIISSGGQIFKHELLAIPTIACINRHTALLPKYGGVLPVFWAMFYNEKEFGVSIHYMVKNIDQGDIVYQEGIPLNKNNSLFKNYIIGFDKSIEVTIKALGNVLNNKIISHFYPNKKQYFSFPTLAIIKEFKKSNKSFSLSDMYFYLFR